MQVLRYYNAQHWTGLTPLSRGLQCLTVQTPSAGSGVSLIKLCIRMMVAMMDHNLYFMIPR